MNSSAAYSQSVIEYFGVVILNVSEESEHVVLWRTYSTPFFVAHLFPWLKPWADVVSCFQHSTKNFPNFNHRLREIHTLVLPFKQNPMKRILSLIFFTLALAVSTFAQNISVKSFEYLENDLTANLQGTMVKDQNGEKCALIRIQTTQKGFAFDVGMLGIVKVEDNHVGEIWLYVPRGVKRISIRHGQLGSLNDYWFPISIQAARTYRMELVTANVRTIVEHDDGKSYFSLTVKPSNAIVMIDGKPQILNENGELFVRLSCGEHSYSVQSPGYQTEESKFTLGVEKVFKEVVLQSLASSVTLTCATPGASLYVNDEIKGTGRWTGELFPGDYLFEARMPAHYPQKLSVTLGEREQKNVELPALEAQTGNLDVQFMPLNSEVYLDGKRLGTTPDLFRSVLVGTHKVEIKKEGYATKTETITIEEGQTAALAGELEKNVEPVQNALASSGGGASGAEKKTFTVNGVPFNMVKVDGGTFTMGATPEQGGDADSDEKPTHRVTLDGYYIGETEVTQVLWQAVMGKNPSYFKAENLPVEQVSWDDCQTFIKKLNELTGGNFALPTEAQWEFAARGGNKSQGTKYSGSDDIDDVAWHESNSSSKTHAVGTKQPNELGLYDMSGNVWEWCADWYGSYSSAAVTNPAGPASGSGRVNRGGSWSSDARYSRTSRRLTSDYRFNNLGLRLVSQL